MIMCVINIGNVFRIPHIALITEQRHQDGLKIGAKHCATSWRNTFENIFGFSSIHFDNLLFGKLECIISSGETFRQLCSVRARIHVQGFDILNNAVEYIQSIISILAFLHRALCLRFPHGLYCVK